MAGIFALIVLAMLAILWKRRTLAIAILCLGMILMLAMFWHHATDILKINL